MATIKVFNNIFENKSEEFTYDTSRPLLEQIEEHIDKDLYKSTMVECYDPQTGETFYAPMEDENDTEGVLIVVNGQSVDKDYQPQEHDLVNVIFTPLGGLSDNVKRGMAIGAGVGSLAAIASIFVASFIPGVNIGVWVALGVLAAGVGVGLLVGGAIGLNEDMKALAGQQLNSKTKNGKDSEQLPDVRGCSNQSLVGNNFPYVIGKHLVTPFIIGDPYTEYKGDRGKDAYIRELLCVGYGPLKLTDFKLGDFMLAYNRSHGTITKKTLIAGELSGYSSGGVADNGDILDFWEKNDVHIEIIQQPKDPVIKTIDPYFQSRTEIDLARRPMVPASAMNAQGWDVPEGETCTVYSQSYSNSNNTVTILLTPIGAMGTVISPESLEAYADILLNQPTHPSYKTLKKTCLLATFTGSDSVQQAETYAQALHENQEEYYFEREGISYGSIYPEVVKEQKVDANLFFIADKELTRNVPVSYKGVSFPNLYRTNTVIFTEACPREFVINLDFPSGLYKTRSETTTIGDTSVTESKYYKIPLWLCVQWRVYNPNNKTSQEDGSDYNSWNTVVFEDYNKTFDATAQAADMAAHSGNEFDTTAEQLYRGFRGKELQNFEDLSGEDGIDEIRVSAKVVLTKEQCEQVITDTNPTKCIEVRVLRVSPNYINETSTEGHAEGIGMWSYSDHVKVTTVVTKTFDYLALRDNNELKPTRVLSESDLKKLCLVAISCKADASGFIQNNLDEITCTAESFSPIWDEENKKISPEGIEKKTKYYGYFVGDTNQRTNRTSAATEREVTKADYEQARHDGFNWYAEKCGSNFADIMKDIVFADHEYITPSPFLFPYVKKEVWWLPDEAVQYNDNLSSSGFLLSLFGPQNGPEAVGEEDANILSICDWAETIKGLEDGSTFPVAMDYKGVHYNAGDLIPVRYEANAYIYSAIKIEDLLQKLAFTGRAVWIVDETGKVKVVFDGPVPYTKGVIASENCISSSNAYTYEEPPAGLFNSFKDENDGFENNSFYVWSDGNTMENHHGVVEQFSADYVTNNIQMNSLSRYVLANRILNKEVLTRKIGPGGVIYSLGEVVLIQGEDLLIGDVSGRIQEVIEDDERIYGFITDATYEYTGETLEGVSVQGVTVIQQRYMGKSNAVTIPLSAPVTKEIDGKTYTLQPGQTNLVLFAPDGNVWGKPKGNDDPSPTSDIKYNMKTGDIVLYGLIDKIAAPYRIIRIKPEANGCFSQTLMPYNEDLYNYGKELPVFQSYITPPPAMIDPAPISEVPTTLKEMNQNLQNVYNAIGVPKDATPPDPPTSVNVVASRDYITVTWSNSSSNIKHTVIELSKDSGTNWTTVAKIDSDNWRYNFDRGTDGYPEADSGSNKLSTWKFRLYNVSMSDVEGDPTTAKSVDTDNYGTWIPAVPSFVSKTPSEGGITLTWNQATGQRGRTLYGTQKYTVTVKYEDTEHSVSEITLGTLVTNTLTVNYDFDRASNKDGYPEVTATANYKGLNKYKFSLSVENESGGQPVSSTESGFVSGETDDYGTWIPTAPVLRSAVAEENGIAIEWNAVKGNGNRQLYGSVKYKATVSYITDDTTTPPTEETRGTIEVDGLSGFYTFNRASNLDGYPEKPNVTGAVTTLDNYRVKLEATNTIPTDYIRTTVGTESVITYDDYKTWIPHPLTLSGAYAPRYNSTKRCATIFFVPQDDVYGSIKYGILVSRVDTDNNQFYTPDLDTDCYSDIDSYKLQTQTPLETTSSFKQNLPLLGQDMMSVQLDRYDRETKSGTESQEHLAISREYYVCDNDGETEFYAHSDGTNNGTYADHFSHSNNPPNGFEDITETVMSTSWLTVGTQNADHTTRYVDVHQIATPLPVDTGYKYRIYAENRFGNASTKQTATVDILIYATANSAGDLVDKAITSNKLDDQCVTTDKIAAGSITAEQLAVTNLLAKGAYAGTMRAEGIMADGSGFWVGNGSTMKYDYKDPVDSTDKTYNATSGEFFVGNNPNHESDPTVADEFIHFKPARGSTPSQFWIAIKNIIFQTLQTIVTGIFRVKNNKTDSDTNAFLTVNPTSSANNGTPATTMKVKGDILTTDELISLTRIEVKDFEGDSPAGNTYNRVFITPDSLTLLKTVNNSTKQIFMSFDSTTYNSIIKSNIFKGNLQGRASTAENADSADNATTALQSYSYKMPTNIASTAASAAKEANYPVNIILTKGLTLMLNLGRANTAASALTLNVKNTGAKTIRWNGIVTSSTHYAMPEGLYDCYYDGTYWNMTNVYEVNTSVTSSRLDSIATTNIRIGSAQAKISLNQLMTWLITTKGYIPSGVDCYKVLGVPWDYAGNDILQLSANGVNYELQLAGCLIEFMGYATNYNTGRFRLTIHSSPTNSFTVSSNYEKFPVSTAVTYTCNGSGYTPVWKMDIPVKKANGFWGLQTPKSDGTWIDSDWIRTTTQGIIPYQSGGASAGHQSLGTSSWYFATAYIQNIYGYLNGNISGNSATATTARNARNTIAICSTASATVAKVATLDGYALTSGDRIPLYMTNNNTASTPTLNVNSTGAKTIRINGSTVVTATHKNLPAGFYMAHYDGTYWNLYNLVNMSTATSFNGTYSSGTGSITTNTNYGALGVVAWYMSTTAGYIVYSNGLKIQWTKYKTGFSAGVAKDDLYLPIAFTSPDTCEILGYYDNSEGTMAMGLVCARLYGNNTNRFKALTQGGSYSFYAIGY